MTEIGAIQESKVRQEIPEEDFRVSDYIIVDNSKKGQQKFSIKEDIPNDKLPEAYKEVIRRMDQQNLTKTSLLQKQVENLQDQIKAINNNNMRLAEDDQSNLFSLLEDKNLRGMQEYINDMLKKTNSTSEEFSPHIKNFVDVWNKANEAERNKISEEALKESLNSKLFDNLSKGDISAVDEAISVLQSIKEGKLQQEENPIPPKDMNIDTSGKGVSNVVDVSSQTQSDKINSHPEDII